MALQIDEQLSRPSLLPSVLLAVRGALFPENAFPPTRAQPTSAEVAEIKRVCATAILQAVPAPVRCRFFATQDDDAMRRDVECTLDLFADSYINRHFVVSAVELLVVRLFPELTAESVSE